MSSKNRTIKLSGLNGHLICGLCGGYLIDATVLTECIHVFCRSCILKYLMENKVCPLCQRLIQETRPDHALRPDVALQRVVYKLVPGLLRMEMDRISEFHATLSRSSENESLLIKFPLLKSNASDSSPGFCRSTLPTALATRSLSKTPSVLPPTSKRSFSGLEPDCTLQPSTTFLVNKDELISLSLIYITSQTDLPPSSTCTPNSALLVQKNYPSTPFTKTKDLVQSPRQTVPISLTWNPCSQSIHLLCPSVVTLQTLSNLLLAKYQLDPKHLIADFYLDGECLEPSHSLREIAFLYTFPVQTRRMCIDFVFTESNLAWWGRPMPCLDQKELHSISPHRNGWCSPLSSSPDSIDSTVDGLFRPRAQSVSGESGRLVCRLKSKRTSL